MTTPSTFPDDRTTKTGAAKADRRVPRLRGLPRALLVACLVVVAAGPARADELQDVSKLVSSGRLDDAEKRADAFLVKTPKDAQMRFLKGVILAQRGKRDEAAAVFIGISQDFPELPEPYNNLAVIYAAQGQYDKARGALESSIRVSPNYATAYENLGDVYAALAARSYQDARRYDAGNAGALRKLNAARAMLTTPTPAASSPAPSPAPVADAKAAAPVAQETIRSQRNVGLPSPAGPRVTVGGFGAEAPEIIVSASATSVPPGSNVVAIENAPTVAARDETSTLAGATTVVGADPAQPVAAVTAAVKRWALARTITTDELAIRIDGDVAVAKFHGTVGGSTSDRTLTLHRDGAAWTVTGEGGAS